MARLKTKIDKVQAWVPRTEREWDLLEEAKSLGWDDRDKIKEAIRLGKAFKPTDEEEVEPEPVRVEETAPEITYDTARFTVQLPSDTVADYEEQTGDRRRLPVVKDEPVRGGGLYGTGSSRIKTR